MRAARAALGVPERLAAAEAVAAAFASRPELRAPGYVAGYWAVGGELPLHRVQTQLAPGQVWCLPVVQDGHLVAILTEEDFMGIAAELLEEKLGG